MKNCPRWTLLLIAGLYMSAILYSSTLSFGGGGHWFLGLLADLAHFPVYLLLMILLVLSLQARSRAGLALAFFIAVFFGVLNEFVQLHVPGRSFSAQDIFTNALGALTAVLFLRKYN